MFFKSFPHFMLALSWHESRHLVALDWDKKKCERLCAEILSRAGIKSLVGSRTLVRKHQLHDPVVVFRLAFLALHIVLRPWKPSGLLVGFRGQVSSASTQLRCSQKEQIISYEVSRTSPHHSRGDSIGRHACSDCYRLHSSPQHASHIPCYHKAVSWHA